MLFGDVCANTCVIGVITVIDMWPGGVMVMTLDSRLKGSRFDSQPSHFQLTILRKLFTHMLPSPNRINWYRSKGNDALQLGR